MVQHSYLRIGGGAEGFHFGWYTKDYTLRVEIKSNGIQRVRAEIFQNEEMKHAGDGGKGCFREIQKILQLQVRGPPGRGVPALPDNRIR